MLCIITLPGVSRQGIHPRVLPLRVADVADLPPTCIHAAELGPLRNERCGLR